MKRMIGVAGATLALESHGTGVPVLFIQGVGMAGRAWRPQALALADRCECVAYDNRGVGSSVDDHSAVTIDSLARDALAVLDAAGFSRAHVVGHSMGGVVAQQLAIDHPTRVRSLALLCTFSRGREAVRPRWPMFRHGLAATVGTARSRARGMARLITSPHDVGALGIDEVTRRLGDAFGRPVAQRPPVARRQLAALARHDATARLPALRAIPSLVMSGTDDLIAPPEYGRALATAIGARYVELVRAGHAMTILQADAVNDALRAHIDSVRS